MIDKKLLEILSEKPAKKAKKFIERWQGFAGKVTQRYKDIIEEADEGIDEIIEMNPVDVGPISAALTAVSSRFLGLGSKVSGALDKIEREWDDTFDDMKLKGKEEKALRKLWDQFIEERDKLYLEIEIEKESVDCKKSADWCRVLYNIVKRDAKKPVNCPQCGGQFENKIRWATMNVKCPNCDAVNEIIPSTAAGLFFGGNGVHGLAHEASFDLWKKMTKEENRYNNMRKPGGGDLQRYKDAVTSYWNAYYEFNKKIHPGFNKTVEEMVDAKLAHYRAYVWK
jgi:phage FluMu protein Com